MSKSALGDSPLFDTRLKDTPPSIESSPSEGLTEGTQVDTKIPAIHDTQTPDNHDTMPPPYNQGLVANIRKKVKEYGKEAATFRFTQDEKRTLREIIYKFSIHDIHTSENEIARISINFIFEDYKRSGRDSILHRVIDALNG